MAVPGRLRSSSTTQQCSRCVSSALQRQQKTRLVTRVTNRVFLLFKGKTAVKAGRIQRSVAPTIGNFTPYLLSNLRPNASGAVRLTFFMAAPLAITKIQTTVAEKQCQDRGMKSTEAIFFVLTASLVNQSNVAPS